MFSWPEFLACYAVRGLSLAARLGPIGGSLCRSPTTRNSGNLQRPGGRRFVGEPQLSILHNSLTIALFAVSQPAREQPCDDGRT